MSIEEFAKAVYTYAQQFHASCTSWGRTPAHNAKVGGVAGSPHVSWLGADLVFDTPPPASHAEVAKALNLTVIEESDHFHLQPSTWVVKS